MFNIKIMRKMNGRNLVITMHNKFGERQVYVMPETFAIEVETNATEIYVFFKKYVDEDEKITSMVIDTEDCDTDVFNEQALHSFQSMLADKVCQGICEHLLQREENGCLIYDLNVYSKLLAEPTKHLYNSLVHDESNLKQ